MKIYRCVKRFFATPLKRYLPVGALVCRWENVAKLVINDAPESDDLFTILFTGQEYDDPEQVTWVYGVEPPPLGTDTEWMELVASYDEDVCGDVGGATGLQGPQGPGGGGGGGSQGPAGPQGFQGSVGSAGSDGTQGPQGNDGTGAQGAQGDAGGDGAQGFQGPLSQGPQGPQGQQGDPGGAQGFQGPAGAQGDAGGDGVQGPQGGAGGDGAQGPQGDAGGDGVQGPQGDVGAQGVQGPQGDAGGDGAQGFQGDAGDGGVQGAVGPQGFQGFQGPQGADGVQGFQGILGTQGLQGADQTLYRYQVESTSGEEVEVLADGNNITYSRAGNVGTFTIPSGTRIISAMIRVPSSVQVAGQFVVDLGTNDMGNTGNADRWQPIANAVREDTGAVQPVTVTFGASASKYNLNNMNTGATTHVRLAF